MFDHGRLYRASDPELEIIASPGVLAQWRHKGAGPEYIKLTNRILYEGAVLNAWLDAHRVVPAAA